MKKQRILIIEDDPDIQGLVKHGLERDGYGVACAASGEEGLRLAKHDPPALLVLDLMLPDIDGLEVLRRMRANPKTADVPTVIASAKGEEADIVAGLELGADDYVTKPFSPRVLTARVRAVLRRRETAPPAEGEVLRVHGLTIHPGRHEVLVGKKPVELTFTEFRILHFLARRPGWVFPRSRIVDSIHGGSYPVTDRAVDVQIVGLRRKLGKAGDLIETVRGVGYRLKE
jgi:two-component system phosphate regulon response regulator PhoB